MRVEFGMEEYEQVRDILEEYGNPRPIHLEICNMKENHTEDLLDMEFYSNDFNSRVKIRDYLKALLKGLFEQGEGFNGKRPLGTSIST